MLITANWREWYHFRHQQECFKSGTAFEDYVSKVLAKKHVDFINPAPVGSLGDGGCDGIAEDGRVLYACYGQRPGRHAVERELEAKISADHKRALQEWPEMGTWIFVTNAQVGPLATKTFTLLQRQHGKTADRPLEMQIWNPEKLWNGVLRDLPESELNELFPGCPGIENIDLADLLPLLDALGNTHSLTEVGGTVAPVPANKMDFNSLSGLTRVELNSGRVLASRINNWYGENSDPSLCDSHGEAFKAIYISHRSETENSTEIVERLYVSLAGPNFRMDRKRANAAYAVVSYFFDTCHIFETPPTVKNGAHV